MMPNRSTTQRGGSLDIACLIGLACALLSASCAPIGAIGHALSDGIHQPVYTPIDQLTLVFVQVHPEAEPVLGGPMHRERIAANVTFHLKHQRKITDFVSPLRVHELATRMGSRYHEQPPAVATIGREVGARQVIIVDVLSATLRDTPGMIEPKAEVRVTVIEVNPYRRLFPVHESAAEDHRLQPPGHLVNTNMPRVYDSSPDFEQLNRIAAMLASQVGRDAARLFFRWDEKRPGPVVREQ
ncbi:MAG: hypothetical protein JJU36_14585 [Phycisphaeraceae bacterium]|nr:hypothetical protein [Phycisphaeraceae bacterium]